MTKRYLLIKIVADTPLSKDQFANALTQSVRNNFGEIGLSRIDARVLRFETEQARAIVSCRAELTNELQTAMSLISEASGTPLIVLVTRVSGTVKSLAKRKAR